MRKGVPKEKLIINAYGSTQPAASNSTAEGRKQNRRVELQMLVELEIPK
jgi:chemotaxis protein MotB